MQYRNKIIALASVLGALVVLFVLGTIFSPANVLARRASEPLFARINPDLVKNIYLDDVHVHLKLNALQDNQGHSQSQWQIAIEDRYFKSQEDKVAQFLSQVLDLRRIRTISRDRTTWAQFQVDEQNSLKCRLTDESDNVLLRLFVGKPEEGHEGFYIRINDDPNVYLTSTQFVSHFNDAAPAWTYLDIIPDSLGVTRDSVENFTVNGAVTTNAVARRLDYTLERAQAAQTPRWVVQGSPSTTLSEDAVNTMIDALVAMEGEEIVAHPVDTATGFNHPQATVSFTAVIRMGIPQPVTIRFTIGNKIQGEDRCFIRVNDIDFAYKVANWRIDRLLKPLSDLLPGAQASTGTSGAAGAAVRTLPTPGPAPAAH